MKTSKTYFNFNVINDWAMEYIIAGKFARKKFGS